MVFRNTNYTDDLFSLLFSIIFPLAKVQSESQLLVLKLTKNLQYVYAPQIPMYFIFDSILIIWKELWETRF